MTEFIILVAAMMSIVAITIDAMLPALGIMGRDLGIAYPNQIQLVISFLFIGMTAGELLCGPLSDALGRKKILYSGLAVFALGSVICYQAQSIEMMLFGRIVQGLGVSGPYVSAVAIVRDKFSGTEMARIMSLVMMIFILVPAFAPALGQAILLMGSWRMIFVMYIGLAVALAVWITFRLAETLPPEKRIRFNPLSLALGFREVFSNRVTMCYTLCMGIAFGSFIGYLNSSQQIFQEQFKTGEMFVLYFGGLALVLGAASLVNARIVGKTDMQTICIRATGGIIVTSALFLLVHFITDVTLWMFVSYAAVLFFSFGLMFGNINAIAMEPMGHVAGIATAVIGATSSAMSLTIGTAIGQMYDNTLIPIVSGFFILNIISLLLMLYVRRLPRAV